MLTEIFTQIIGKDPSVKRHLAKTISWRIIGSFDTMMLGWFVTGNITFGARIGAFELVTKMLLYFVHERAWYRVNFGVPGRFRKAEKVRRQNASKLFHQESKISRQEREKLNEHNSFTIWLTGLSAAGKSTIAQELHVWFHNNKIKSYVVDGDNTRIGLNSDLSFSKEDRSENIRRVAEVCKLFNDAGIIAIASFISPYEADRLMAKNIIGMDDFIEVFVDASIESCKARDKKGLYKLAEEGKVKDFTGVSSPYEQPTAPDVHLHTDQKDVAECVKELLSFIDSLYHIAAKKFTFSPLENEPRFDL